MKMTPLFARLREVRAGGPLIQQVSEQERPASLAAAYAIAAALVTGRALAGYKIGATTGRGRQVLALSEPFFGRIMADTLHRSPATLRIPLQGVSVELELGCELGSHLPARVKEYSRAEVAASVRRVVPLMELNAPSYAHPFEVGGLCLIADNGVNAGAVLGAPGSKDLYTLREGRAALSVKGGTTLEGATAAAPDDPLSALTWLANALSREGLGLQEGQFVATGAVSPPLEVKGPCVLRGDFGALGGLEVTFVQ